MIVYAVVEYFNDYDQHGGYVRGLYKTKESAEKSVDHFDRRDYEYSWYELELMEVNP
jgi:hypothetical protein